MLTIQLQVIRLHPLKPKAPTTGFMRGMANRPCKAPPPEEDRNLPCKAAPIVWRDQHTGLLMNNLFRNAAHPKCDTGQSETHGFKNNKRMIICKGRIGKNITRSHKVRHGLPIHIWQVNKVSALLQCVAPNHKA